MAGSNIRFLEATTMYTTMLIAVVKPNAAPVHNGWRRDHITRAAK